MLEIEESKRYQRQIILSNFGVETQNKIKEAKVSIIGIGGLGCPIALYLAAAGVGTIALIDGDKIQISNLNRQILFQPEDIGNNKAEIAAQKIKTFNPSINIIPISHHLSQTNANDLLKDYHLIIDATDNFETRYLINDTCLSINIPYVYGAISGFEGQISVFNYKNNIHYRDLFPHASDVDIANCDVGVIGVLPGIIGNMMANEAIKMITGIGEVLSGKLWVFDALTSDSKIFDIDSKLPVSTQPSASLSTFNAISWAEYKKDKKKYVLVDVRECFEYEENSSEGLNIPLNELLERASELPSDSRIIFYCTTNKRSMMAIHLLRKSFKNEQLFYLKSE